MAIRKKDLPLHEIRRFLEPGPIVLVTSAYKNETNIMTMGWFTVMEFQPSLIGCIIAGGNHSFDLIRKSKECVINIPEVSLLDTLVAIGNSDGKEIDKFKEFGLTKSPSKNVKAPSIAECYANFECKLYDGKLIDEYNFFIFEVVRARTAIRPKYPKTVHYRGEGIFMVSGDHVSRRRDFKPDRL